MDGPQNHELAAWTNGKRAVLLLVFKQPNANVITTADGVKAKLPSLQANIPPNIHLSVVSDRTLTIRASVDDVEFTLMLAIALVVMVIFLFLRNVWATIIPSITIPVALVGTLGAMYLCGFSLDNLSLMGLTIAVGFVVDDAIVMLENIFRHIEDGMKPFDAAMKGAGEIGFTIVSISFSLIAVFIPLLMMGGIVGRLFREFAICVSMTIVISAHRLADADADDGSRFLSPKRTSTAASTISIEGACSTAMLRFYERTLDVALRFRFITLLVFLATVSVTRAALRHHPQGVLPDPGYRHHHRHHRRGAGHLLPRDGHLAAAGEQHRPGRPGSCLGGRVSRRRRGRSDRKQRPHVHHAEALGRAHGDAHAGDRAASTRRRRLCRASGCSCSRRRTCAWARALGRTHVPIHAAGCRPPPS